MSESRYRRAFERLRAKWADSGILAPAVADNSLIAEFEQRYRVVLPDDLRTYFTTVNGTIERRLGMDDADLIGFWHLDQVRTFAEEELADIPDASSIFAFADQSIQVYTYGVRLSDGAAAPTPVVATVGSSHVVVSPSFVEFIERYLHGDRSAIYPV